MNRLRIPERFRRQGTSSILGQQLQAALCPGMTLPTALEQLFLWIEARGHFVDTAHGRAGYISRRDRTHHTGTYIEFNARGNADLHHWFGTSSPEILDRLCVFAKTGWDGSMAAFWLNDDGAQTIVHMGSGSGSVMVCTLADNPVDFLRLLAIGYDEICWEDQYAQSPVPDDRGAGRPDLRFATWVAQTFNVTMPDRGAEIVPHPDSVDAPTSDDLFWQWVQKNVA